MFLIHLGGQPRDCAGYRKALQYPVNFTVTPTRFLCIQTDSSLCNKQMECQKLRSSLSNTHQKLKVQDEVIARLTDELHFTKEEFRKVLGLKVGAPATDVILPISLTNNDPLFTTSASVASATAQCTCENLQVLKHFLYIKNQVESCASQVCKLLPLVGQRSRQWIANSSLFREIHTNTTWK